MNLNFNDFKKQNINFDISKLQKFSNDISHFDINKLNLKKKVNVIVSSDYTTDFWCQILKLFLLIFLFHLVSTGNPLDCRGYK